jgi:hypothetical protein
VINKYPPHRLRRHAKEVGSTFPPRVRLVHKAQKRFMHQRCRLERVIEPLPGEARSSQQSKFLVHQWQESACGRVIAAGKVFQQSRNFRFRAVSAHFFHLDS